MRRNSFGISLLEIILSIAIVTIGITTSLQVNLNARRGLLRPLRLWQAQIAGQSVADAVSALQKNSYISLLQGAPGATQFNPSNQPWLAQWQRGGVQSISFVVSLKKNGTTCSYPGATCTPSTSNPFTENLAGWSSEIVVDVLWRGESSGAVQTLSWSKFVPATP